MILIGLTLRDNVNIADNGDDFNNDDETNSIIKEYSLIIFMCSVGITQRRVSSADRPLDDIRQFRCLTKASLS